MNKVQKLALIYLLSILLLGYGYAVGRFQVFPHQLLESLIQDYQIFAEGDPLEKDSSAVAKLRNDWGFSFGRWNYDYPKNASDGSIPLPYSKFRDKREPPLIFLDQEHRTGYRVIVGAFDMLQSFWGALLIDPEGQIIHSWNLTTEHIPGKFKSDRMKNLYGVHVFPDGSVIYNMTERSGGIVKVDACSNIVWNLLGSFHHAVSPDEDGSFWTFIGKSATYDQDLVRASQKTGEILSQIKMADVRAANPNLHIWNLGLLGNQEIGHMTHANDVDPLPQHLVADFPGLEAGDLAISYASTNLVFILNPQTLLVKWWRVGVSDFHHDPDWEPGGMISLFSNNQRSDKGSSDIVTIDYLSMKDELSVDGGPLKFYSNANGRHQLTPYGTRLVTSSKQGWAFETDENGKVIFSFVNNVDSKERQALHLSEAWRFDEDYFETDFWNFCTQETTGK